MTIPRHASPLARTAPLLLALALALPLACKATRGAEPVDLWRDAAGSIDDPDLASLCTDAWEYELALDPVRASRLGDSRYDGVLPDRSLAAQERHERALRRFVERAEAIQRVRLSDQELLTLRELHRRWTNELALLATGADLESWNLEPRSGVHTDFLSLAPDQPMATRAEREQMLERWSAMPRAIGQQMDNLRRGLARGRVAPKISVERVLAQLDELLATPVEDSPLAHPGAPEGSRGDVFGDDMDAHVRTLALVRNEIYPAFRRYREMLRTEILPRARPNERAGVMYVEDGSAYYRLAIPRYTSLELSPEEINAFGRAEVERIRGEMIALGRETLGIEDLAALQLELREDPALHFHSSEAVLESARRSLARSEAAVPFVFGRLPRAECVVVPVPEHEAPHQTIAYYEGPAADKSRPGRYYVNAWAPETRPTYDAQALAFHESVPGHHLQIALARELTGLPLVRRHSQETAFVEGWALYAEGLADELELYTGGLDRLGMLSFDAWRASRLVVDTGLHALGWTREQAIQYMLQNTLLAPNNVENEVDRYIAWPGQALAYKIGQREFLALRREAELELGERFVLSDFHDCVLENGAISLVALQDSVRRWIRREGARPKQPVEKGSTATSPSPPAPRWSRRAMLDGPTGPPPLSRLRPPCADEDGFVSLRAFFNGLLGSAEPR